MNFLKSVTFKICLIMTLIEAIFFIILGSFYSYKYINQLQLGLESNIQLPGKLISQGLLDFDSISDSKIIEDIIGEKPLEAYIIGTNQNIFFSLDPNMIGLTAKKIPSYDQNMFLLSSPKVIIFESLYNNIPSKTCIFPVFSFDNASPRLFTYIRVATDSIELERFKIIIGFIIGFLICIILTVITIIIIFRIYIYNPIDESLVVMENVKNGDLFTRLPKIYNSNEMSSLQNGINSMIATIEKKVGDLNSEIVERKKQESEKESLQLTLMQSTKLAELGALSAGIAHEFRNPISGVTMTIQNIKMRLFNKEIENNIKTAAAYNINLDSFSGYLKDRKIEENILMIEGLCQNMNKIIENMLSYSRKTDIQFCTHKIEDIINESLTLANFNPSFRGINEVLLNIEENLPMIECHKNELIQVFLNIINNGSEAMLSLKREKLDYIAKFKIDVSRDHNNIVIIITDNGPGMDKLVQNTLFQPFYTTKDDGKGTGLGLYICKMIVENKHRGKLSIESTINKGSTFKIVLSIEQKIKLNLK